MQIIKKFDKQANYIFYIALVIHIAVMCVGYSAWDIPFTGRLLQLAFGLGCIKILMTYYDKIEWALMILAGAIGIGSYIVTKEKYVLYVVVLLFAAKSVDMKLWLKVILYSSLVATLVVIGLSILGLGEVFKQTEEFRPGTIETRYNLGFSHPNNVHGTLWYIYCLLIMIYKDKLDWRHYAVLESFNVAMFLITDSKAGFTVASLIVLVGIIYKYAGKLFENKLIYILGLIAFGTIIVLTIVAVNVRGWRGYGPILTVIDRVTTGRISVSYNYARMEWWRPFHGYQREDGVIVDNGFASLGNSLGYIVWILYLLFNVIMMWAIAKKKDGIGFAVVITTAMYTFMESTYTLNYTYLMSNLLFVVTMAYLGEKKGISEL